VARAAELARATNQRPGLVRSLRGARELLPGRDDLLRRPSALDQRLTGLLARNEGEVGGTASRELALAGRQAWQALSRRLGRGGGSVEATVLFTEVAGFSSWILQAGDEAALELLRTVAAVVEPAVIARRGRVVKRLGDGHMAAFAAPRDGIDAALDMQASLAGIEVAGHRPQLRAGLHLGRPRELRGDYLGADVNTAARLSEAAGPGEVLVSGAMLQGLGPGDGGLAFRRRRGFRAKGVPPGLEVFVASRE
jgi:adenylate cyclase